MNRLTLAKGPPRSYAGENSLYLTATDYTQPHARYLPVRNDKRRNRSAWSAQPPEAVRSRVWAFQIFPRPPTAFPGARPPVFLTQSNKVLPRKDRCGQELDMDFPLKVTLLSVHLIASPEKMLTLPESGSDS